MVLKIIINISSLNKKIFVDIRLIIISKSNIVYTLEQKIVNF